MQVTFKTNYYQLAFNENVILFCVAGDTRTLEIPRKEVEVVKGQMVMLHAWYSPSSDISKNAVIWNFETNESTQVRLHCLSTALA